MRQKERVRCEERVGLFMQDPFHLLLNNHALGGEYKGYRSINIGGDLRAIYEPVSQNVAFFITLGTHPELYGS
ncbi:MAG: type II toxin-antitoxin system mRNA interferase toxin, RelE/StbE family [Candidatus Sungbacteria bacterium]|nr:type II toxin-antitoxin system mRNA interferase toxin, RelE/StbE family [Candidatus Sungbacteria bacterium]